MTWGGREKKEESTVIAKPGVAVQSYNFSYSGCGGRRIRSWRPLPRNN
jgi:cephalosporin-C deacetylase-like acetyl esterase